MDKPTTEPAGELRRTVRRGYLADRWQRKDGTRTPLWGKGDRYTVRVWNTLDDRPLNQSFPDGRKTAARQFLEDFRSGVWERDERARRASQQAARDRDRVPVLNAYAAEWLTRQHDTKGSTLENYSRHLAHRIGPPLGSLRLDQITRARVDAWLSAMLQPVPEDAPHRPPPPAPGEMPRPCARSTARVALSILGTILNAAADDGLIQSNPTRRVRLSPAVEDVPRAVLTPAQVRALIDNAPDWLRPFVVLIAATGMRQQEAAGLTAGQVRLGLAPHVIVDRQLVSYNAQDGHALGSTKTGRSRRVPLPADAAAVLAAAVEGLPPESLVFTTPAGVPLMRYRTVKLWNTLAAAAGVPVVRYRGWHELRHAYASHQIAAGVPVNAVAAALGHSVEVCLRTYGHLIPDTDNRLRTVAEGLISGRLALENTP